MADLKARPILHAIRRQYVLHWDGLHGISHWARVYENRLRIAERNGADSRMILLFALFHDACRLNDGIDPAHGRRGAELAASLRGELFELPDEQFALLHEACAHHTDGLTKADVIVQTCWDADRLDLARAGFRPSPSRLCTPAAKDPELIAWATERSIRRHTPALVQIEWNLDLE